MKEFEMDFELDGSEELEDEEFAAIDAIGEYLNTLPRSNVYMTNILRVHQMRFAYAILKRVFRETNCQVTIRCGHDDFAPGIGSIRVEGRSLGIADMVGFARAAEFADNMEVYPLSANKVRMSFLFYRLLLPIPSDDSSDERRGE